MTGYDATVCMTEIVTNEPGVNATVNPNVAVAPDHPLVPVMLQCYVGENRQLLLSPMGGMESMRQAVTEQSNAVDLM